METADKQEEAITPAIMGFIITIQILKRNEKGRFVLQDTRQLACLL